jgi:aspartyl-tRNA(Asn)/glutamyl-tRNA(Gln) amidotransferase subunit C
MRISLEEVDHVALLARLGITAAERERFQEQLSSILAYVEQLGELDTSQVSPSAQIFEFANVTRPDVAQQGLTTEQALANAPEHLGGYFVVPPVLDNE